MPPAALRPLCLAPTCAADGAAELPRRAAPGDADADREPVLCAASDWLGVDAFGSTEFWAGALAPGAPHPVEVRAALRLQRVVVCALGVGVAHNQRAIHALLAKLSSAPGTSGPGGLVLLPQK